MTITELTKEIRERLEKATPGPKYVERLEGHGEGLFRYEINHSFVSLKTKERCLVAFYEDSHQPILRAKFNAELFANASTDLQTLIAIVKRQQGMIETAAYSQGDSIEGWAYYVRDEAKQAIFDVAKLIEGVK